MMGSLLSSLQLSGESMTSTDFLFRVHLTPFQLGLMSGDQRVQITPDPEVGNPIPAFLSTLESLLQGPGERNLTMKGRVESWTLNFVTKNDNTTLQVSTFSNGQSQNARVVFETAQETLDLVQTIWRSFRIVQSTVTEKEWTSCWEYTFPEAELDNLMVDLQDAQAQAEI
jgi:hypothetical protein